MTVSNTPKVSVCIPAFNAAGFLRQAVESVLEQSYRDFEIVIVDNCSTDQTGALIDELLKISDGRIRYYKNDRNIGLVGNFNRCLEYARGSYIKFLCADDLLLPGCLERMAALRPHTFHYHERDSHENHAQALPGLPIPPDTGGIRFSPRHSHA